MAKALSIKIILMPVFLLVFLAPLVFGAGTHVPGPRTITQNQPYWKWQPAPPDMQLHLTAMLSLRNQGEMEKLKTQLQQPGSTSYHKWLSSAEFAQRFGPTAAQMETVTKWLTQRGFSIESADLERQQVRFSGSVARLHQALGVEFVSNGSSYANLNNPRIPRSLAGSVEAFFGLDNLNSHSAAVVQGDAATPQFKFPGGKLGPYFSPQDFWNFYFESDPTVSGANGGTTAPDCIALLEYNPPPAVTNPPAAEFPSTCSPGGTYTPVPVGTSTPAIVNVFTNEFCLPAAQMQFVFTDPNVPPTYQPVDNEPNLDADWAHAIAPNTPIKMYISTVPNSSTPALDTLIAAVTDPNFCGVISSSIDDRGGQVNGTNAPCPSIPQIQTYAQVEAQAVMQGQTLFHSSGDFGANYLCGQPGPTPGGVATGMQPSIEESFASSDVTVVGGTQFNPTYDPNNNYADTSQLGPGVEEVWHFPTPVAPTPVATPTKGASGGGISQVFEAPSWQSTITPYGLTSPLTMRGVPDVSIAASGTAPGYWIATTEAILKNFGFTCGGPSTCSVGVGGTSASSPIWAAISRLIAQQQNNRLLGNINPYLYQIAATQSSTNPALVDVTLGGTNCTIDQTGTCPSPTTYQVGTGYDLGTGWGSPNITQLLAEFKTFTPSPTAAPTPRAVLNARPAPLTFGKVPVGANRQRNIQLTNKAQKGGASIFIGGIAIEGTGPFSESNNCPAVLSPKQACSVTVTFSPSQAGPAKTFLNIFDNSRWGKVNIGLQGTGK